MANFGSFGSAIGGGSAISAALQRRRTGDSVSPLSQVSGAAPSFSGAAPMPPTPAPQGAMPTGAPTGAPTGGAGPSPTSEAELIIKALSERLRSLSKVDIAKLEPPQLAPAPTPAPAPAPAPMPSLGGI